MSASWPTDARRLPASWDPAHGYVLIVIGSIAISVFSGELLLPLPLLLLMHAAGAIN